MAEFHEHVLGMLQPKDLIATGFTISRPNDPLEPLFDDVTTNNLVAEYHSIASQYLIPQIALYHAFDVPAQKSIPAPIDEHSIKQGLIKVKRSTTELLSEKMDHGMTAEPELYREVVNFAAQLADQVVTRTKVARAEVVATGKMTIKENGIDLTVDYNVPAENLALELDFSEDAEHSVPEQLDAIVAMARQNGVILSGMVTSYKVMGLLRRNADVQKAVHGATLIGATVSNSDLRGWLSDEYGITNVIVDDLTYSLPYTTDENGRPKPDIHRYYPENCVSFFGTVGGMKLASNLWGIPPEQRIAQFYASAGASDQNPYVYMTQWIGEDPATLWTKATALYMPVLYSPDSLYVAKIKE